MSKAKSSRDKDIDFVGDDLVLEGTIHSHTKLVINGTIKGMINGEKEILIGENGQVFGKIEGKSVIVAGQVEGDMTIHDHLEISATGRVEGEINVPPGKMVIREGAKVIGQCMTSKPVPANS